MLTLSATSNRNSTWSRLHIDAPLLGGLTILAIFGLFILYSAGNQNIGVLVRQLIRFALAFIVLLGCAQIPPRYYVRWAPYIFGVALFLLFVVLVLGHIGKGARRWLELGFLNFQPSELMKIAMPMMLAWYLSDKTLPPKSSIMWICILLLLIPVLLTAKEPDLGTAILIGIAGCMV